MWRVDHKLWSTKKYMLKKEHGDTMHVWRVDHKLWSTKKYNLKNVVTQFMRGG